MEQKQPLKVMSRESEGRRVSAEQKLVPSGPQPNRDLNHSIAKKKKLKPNHPVISE